MHILLVHPNFPGQFRHLAPSLAARPEHRVVGIGDAAQIQGRPLSHPRLQVLGYQLPIGDTGSIHPYLAEYDEQVRRGQAVYRLAGKLKARGFTPDLVVAHPGWGDALFLRDLFPAARHLHYCEYYYRSQGGDLDFDPEFPSPTDLLLKARIRNSAQLQGLVSCDQAWSPTAWQRQCYPAEFQGKIRVLHEGVDTGRVAPDPGASLQVGESTLKAGDEVVTYVARNLEPHRGFHTFMRALPRLLARRPRARVLIIGGDGVSYGFRLPPGQTYKDHYCRELGERLDPARVHFLGPLAYGAYLRALQVSAAHVYLTYPFALSWSLLEAMAAGCTVIGSDTPPVREVIRHGENGLLTGFFDADALADQVAEVLAQPERHRHLGSRARESVQAAFDLRRHCLPAQIDFLLQG